MATGFIIRKAQACAFLFRAPHRLGSPMPYSIWLGIEKTITKLSGCSQTPDSKPLEVTQRVTWR